MKKHALFLEEKQQLKLLEKEWVEETSELVLRMLKNTQKLKKMIIASMGTDGIDGNSNFAGPLQKIPR